MRVHEIAKQAGVDVGEVLKRFEIEAKQGAAMKDVDDGEAEGYIASKLDEAEAKAGGDGVVRFWSPRTNLKVLASDGNHIEFSDHVFLCKGDSQQAAALREQRDSLRVYEIIKEPHGDRKLMRQFMMYLEEQIFKGIDKSEGPSSAGRDSVKRMLPPEMLDELPSDVKNPPASLIDAVVDRVSLNVETYPLERGGM